MTTQIPFLGIMDLDSSNETILKGFHKYARNILFKGNRAENIKGTRNIPYTLPAGTNEVIGSFYDELKKRVIWFNCNSNNNHGIYQMVNGIITAITVCAGTDYLNFTKAPIHSINILYGDDTIGDIIYFIDSLKRPTKLNIGRAIAGGYGTIERSFLDVAKEPSNTPPVVAYANDGSATTNNLRKSLFQFACIWEFDDKERSVTSTYSEVPIPPSFLDVAFDTDPTKNSKITVTVKTGKSNVKKIKLVARQNIENVWGDFFLIKTLDKSELSIGNNTTYTYDFKNNTAAQFLDVKESILLFDYVPRESNTQELLNGNIVIYAGIKEGYAHITPNVTITVDDIVSTAGANDITPIYKHSSKGVFALAYFDEKGRTCGAQTNAGMEFTTLAYGESTGTITIPRINAAIHHRPPIEAVGYQWLRSKNQTYQKFLYWVTQSTYKDADFAYIGINNLFTQQDANKKTILTYDFIPGDRVRFIKRIGNNLLTNKDYEIKEQVASPEVGGTVREGIFLKIKLPATDGTFDFGGTGFGNYLVELYTPAQLSGNDLNVFYEFGEAYLIGNPGLSTRYHKGQITEQSTDLTTDATFTFTKGDVYLKKRNVPAGGNIVYDVIVGSYTHINDVVLGLQMLVSDTGNATYTAAVPTPLTNVTDDADLAADNHRWILKTVGDAYLFRIKGTIVINVNNPQPVRIVVQTFPVDNGVELVPPQTLKIGDNTFNFDKTFTLAANSRAYIRMNGRSLNSSDELNIISGTITINEATIYTSTVSDSNFSDTFLSSVNSNGRPHVVDETGETYNPTLLRYSEAYQAGTNINRTNRFYFLNSEEVDRSRGDIQRLKSRGSILRAFQQTGVIPFGIYQKEISDVDGGKSLIVSEKIINKMSYYQGEYGMGNQPCSLASSAAADYITDPVHGQIRVAGDGMTPISKLYKAQYYLPPIVQNYLQSYTTDSGSPSKIIGFYDFYNEQFVSIFQKCKSGSTVIYAGDALAFDEKKNGYSTFYDYPFEWMMCADNVLVSWGNGAIYVHDSTTYNTFQDTAYSSLIDMVVNESSNIEKEFVATGYHSKQEWTYPQITTEMGHQSNLIAADFEKRKGMYSAAFLRDVNSPGGLNDGESLVGVWMQFRIQSSSSTLQFITGLYVNYLVNTKNF